MANACVKCDNEDTGGQGLVVISCDPNIKSNHIIQKILRHFNEISDESHELKPKTLCFGTNQRLDCFEVDINNKYYSTTISLFDIKDKQLIDSKPFNDSINGVLIYFDFNEDSSFAAVQSWQPFIDVYNNEIKLLICETIDHNFDNKWQTIQKWCIGNQFELVEICPQTDDQSGDNETIDEFAEVDGMVRISQAIQAHNWPISSLKDRTPYNPSPKFKTLIDKEVFNSINDNSLTEENEWKPFDERDEELTNFEDLFVKFNEMKVKASQMSETDRRSYAEKVTLAFWKAIDGDPQEIDGLDVIEDNKNN